MNDLVSAIYPDLSSLYPKLSGFYPPTVRVSPGQGDGQIRRPKFLEIKASGDAQAWVSSFYPDEGDWILFPFCAVRTPCVQDLTDLI